MQKQLNMGALDFLCSLCKSTSYGKKCKPMQLYQTTVAIKVEIDCNGSERRIKSSLSSMKGVISVLVNRKQNHVIVTGYVEPNKVLKRVKRIRKSAEFWPTGYVRNVLQTMPSPNSQEEKLTYLFSDENPNACSIM